jgi:hypothetical protein
MDIYYKMESFGFLRFNDDDPTAVTLQYWE